MPNFLSDPEKMTDFKRMSKTDFLASYSYLTEAEYDATHKAVYGDRKSINDVEDVLQKWYGISVDDTDTDQILSSLEDGETPEEIAERIGQKFDLVRIDEEGAW